MTPRIQPPEEYPTPRQFTYTMTLTPPQRRFGRWTWYVSWMGWSNWGYAMSEKSAREAARYAAEAKRKKVQKARRAQRSKITTKETL